MIRVLLLHKHFRPYHMAQARALLQRPELEVRCVELKDAEGGYQPKMPAERIPELTTLASHQDEPGLRQLPQRVWETLEAWQPDCVVVAGYNAAALRHAASWTRARGKACVLILSVTGQRGWREWVKWPAKAGFLYRCIDTAFVGGTVHATYLAWLGMPRERIRPGYEVVDNAHYARRARQAREEAARLRPQLRLPTAYFLYMGRLNGDKNLERLLEAYGAYRRAHPGGWGLVLVGDGPLEDVLKAKARALRLPEVVWAGRRSREEIPTYYGLAAALVLPSIAETWGLPVNEAMAAGLPVVVSRECGCAADLVEPGVTGFVVRAHRTRSIQKGLEAVAALAPEQHEAMGRAGQARVASYSLERWALQLEAAVREAMAHRQLDLAGIRTGPRHLLWRGLTTLLRYSYYGLYKIVRQALRLVGLSFFARRVAGRWFASFFFRLARLRQPSGIFPVGGHAMALAPPGRYPPIDMLMDRYEGSTTRLLKRLLQPGMRVVDGGAHVGYYTLLAARQVGPEGHVYAFEPEPNNQVLLEQNVARNGYRNVTVAPQALWSGRAALPLFVSRVDNGSHSLRHRLVDEGASTIVQATTLDQFLAAEGWPQIDLIKLDLEGAESEALKGMEELIRRQPALALLVEFAPRLLQASGVDPERFLTLLSQLGFALHVVEEHGLQPLPTPIQPLVQRLSRKALYLNLFCQKGLPATGQLREQLVDART